MRNGYSEETKAAVLAALLAGQSQSEVAAQYHIPVGTIAAWSARASGGASAASTSSDKRRRIGELLLTYLEANLNALTVQAHVFAEESWLKKNRAEQVGVLHGILTDKAIRLLEAFARSDTDDDADRLPGELDAEAT